MKTSPLKLLPLTVLLLSICTFTAFQAKAQLIYDNGPMGGGSNSTSEIDGGNAVSNSFTSTGPANLFSVQVGLWSYLGCTRFGGNPFDPLTVDWSIGTTPFASDISSGTSSLTDTLINELGCFEDGAIWQSTFNISGSIGAGTYWLTLTNGTTTGPFPPLTDLLWDENDGPSTAFNNNGQIGSESFQIFGTPACGPPVIQSITATPSSIWPPNNTMVPVSVSVQATAACGIASETIVSVSSNEPGSGQYQITGNLTLNLLAARNGNGTGRIYTITVQVRDTAGNSTNGTTTVTVPHDQRR